MNHDDHGKEVGHEGTKNTKGSPESHEDTKTRKPGGHEDTKTPRLRRSERHEDTKDTEDGNDASCSEHVTGRD